MRKKRAFTMIELIIVVVIIGILVATATAVFPNNKLNNETNYLLLKIKEKQKNSLNYDHYNFGEILWKKRGYSKEYNLTCIDLNITGQRKLYGKSTLDIQEEQENRQKHFYIGQNTNIQVLGLNDQNQSLCFDNLGRPYTMEQKLLKEIIKITLSYNKKKKVILLYPYSGYAIIKKVSQ